MNRIPVTSQKVLVTHSTLRTALLRNSGSETSNNSAFEWYPVAKLNVGKNWVYHGNRRIADGAFSDCTYNVNFAQENASPDAVGWSESSYSVLSFVGPILSFSESKSLSVGGAGFVTAAWHATDVKSGQPATLTDCFQEQDIVAALERDTFFVAHTNATKRKRAIHVNALLRLLQSEVQDSNHPDPQTFQPISLNQFAFHSYDSAKDLVSVRLESRRLRITATTPKPFSLGFG